MPYTKTSSTSCDRIKFCNVLKQNKCTFACLNTKISRYVFCIKNKKNIMKFGICKGYKDLDVRKCMKVGSRHQCIACIKFNGIKSNLMNSNDIKSNTSITKFYEPPRHKKYWFPILDVTTFENKKRNTQLYCSIVKYHRNAMCNQYQR